MYAYTEKTLESIIIYFIKHKLKIKLRSYWEKLTEIPNIFRSIALLLFYYLNLSPPPPFHISPQFTIVPFRQRYWCGILMLYCIILYLLCIYTMKLYVFTHRLNLSNFLCACSSIIMHIKLNTRMYTYIVYLRSW